MPLTRGKIIGYNTELMIFEFAMVTRSRPRLNSEKCHVWTAPAVQEESDVSAKRSGAAMYPAFE
jgi:hypothetical protein